MEEEKEVSVEKEIKERANKIAAKLSNEHNIITLKGEKVVLFKMSKYLILILFINDSLWLQV